MIHVPFELVLFSTDPSLVKAMDLAGVDAFIVDWEHLGKAARQRGADTEINTDTAGDLRRVRGATRRRVICRINAFGPHTLDEVEAAISCGADEILLPMARSAAEVEAVLAMSAGRCGVGILVETVAAVDRASELARLPLSRVYVGLNDLAIDRGSTSIFAALADGTVDRVRRHFSVPFGLGGLTHPELGRPVPARLLIGEMARLACSFSFMRRSFHRDLRGREPSGFVAAIRLGLERAFSRSRSQVEADRESFLAVAAEAGALT
jgi:hypothetical protein